MANEQQPVQLGVQTGLQQFGQEIFVTLSIVSGSLSMALVVPSLTAAAIAKEISEAAKKAATTIVKPVSPVHLA